jgi:tetraacyldisaccharide 4'-kinase
MTEMSGNTEPAYDIVYPRGRRNGEFFTLVGGVSRMLTPLSALYAAGSAIVRSRRSRKKRPSGSVRVVSIGNIEVGGNGKTPFAIHVVENLVARGARPVYISRGFRSEAETFDGVTVIVPEDASLPGSARGGVRFLRKDATGLASVVGDEGAMVSLRCPGVPQMFARDRQRAIDLSGALFDASHLVLDDAFQTWAVDRDVDIVLLDSDHPAGNGRILPAGTLREHPSELKRADIVGFNGITAPEQLDVLTRWLHDTARRDIPAFGMGRDIDFYDSSTGGDVDVEGVAVAAVSSIGRPERFEAALEGKSLRIKSAVRYPDHHRYGRDDIKTINSIAAETGVKRIVTTEKDWVKLREVDGIESDVLVARLRLCVTGADPVAICEKPRT